MKPPLLQRFSLPVSMLLCVAGLIGGTDQIVYGQSCVPIASGLVGWWRAESDALDAVSTNNGTLIGNATFGTGQVGQGFVFDGKGDGVQLGNTPGMQVQDFTIEAWIKRATNTVVSLDSGGGAAILSYGSGGYSFAISDLGELIVDKLFNSQADFSPPLVTDTNWHHVAVTKSGSTVVYYCDGIAYPAANPYNPGFTFGTAPLIGIRGTDLLSSFLGRLDEVAVYNRALGSNEIQDIYNAGAAGKCPLAPVILTQPTSQVIPANASVTFSVSVAGTAPFNFQWNFNGTNLAGQTNISLTITNVQPTNGGAYAVTVTNAGGSVLSSNAVLTVGPLVFCAPPPAGLVSWWQAESNTTDFVGTNNGALVNGAAFAPGEVNQSFNFNGVNQYVSVPDSPSLRPRNLTIEAWVSFTGTTGTRTIIGKTLGNGTLDSYTILYDYNAGHLAAVTSTNGGYGPGLAYNWTPAFGSLHHIAFTFDDDANIQALYLDGSVVAAGGVTNSITYDTHPVFIGGDIENANPGLFWAGLVDELSIYNRALAASEIAAIFHGDRLGKCTGASAPVITGQPQDLTVGAGTNAIFAVLVSGSSPIFYQWQFHGTNLPAGTNNPLVITNAQLALAGSYQVIITNAYGAVTSAPATLTLQSPPVIDTQPQAIGVVPGGTGQFFVAVSGTPPFHFAWFRNATNPVGGNSYVLTLNNVQAADVGNYTVVITNTFGSVTSAPAALVLNFPPAISNQPLALAVPAGANPSFSVVATGSGTLRYQWRFGATNVSGGTNSVLILNNVQAGNAGAYSVLVSNNFGLILSSNALLTVTNPVCVPAPAGLIAWWQAENDTSDSIGTNSGALVNGASFGAGIAGQGFKFNGVNQYVSVPDSPSLRPTNLTVECWFSFNGGSGLRTLVGKPFGSGALDSFTILLNNGTLSSLMSSNSSLGPPLNYVWTPAPGTLHHVAYTFDDGTNTQAMYVDGELVASGTVNGSIAYDTRPVIIGADIENGSPNFFWNGSVDEVSLYNRALSGTEIRALYNATSQGKCPAALSWLVQPASQSVSPGSNATFTAAVAGYRPVSYKWSFNSAPISVATNPVLNVIGVNYFKAGTYSVTGSNLAGAITSSNAMLGILLPPLVPNGSFENGTAGWVTNDLADPLNPLTVRGPGYYPGYGFFSTAPADGNFCLTFGFDGGGPGRVRAAFDVTLPTSPITLTFTYRAAWDMLNYPGSTQARTFGVAIEPYGGGTALQTNTVLTAAPGTANYDTGNVPVSIDLSGFSGRSIRICFDANIPEYFTGPGFFQLDNVVLTYLPVPPFAIARAGTNVVLSWPVIFSNFTATASTSLPQTNAWTLLPTNSIIRDATNATLTLPVIPGQQFYRLRSF